MVKFVKSEMVSALMLPPEPATVPQVVLTLVQAAAPEVEKLNTVLAAPGVAKTPKAKAPTTPALISNFFIRSILLVLE
jgi:hypothetical protein